MASWPICTLIVCIAVLSITAETAKHRRKRAECPNPSNSF